MYTPTSTRYVIRWIVNISLVLALFMFSIDLMISALGNIGQEMAESVISITSYPFVSLFIGLLTTALIQSSSTTTSIIVAMVASGSMDLQIAIPMIIGANIGTTLTSYIVSLSYLSRKGEFRKAFSVATMHNHFNIFVAIVLFPLQYYYNFIGILSEKITEILQVEKVEISVVEKSGLIVGNSSISDVVLDFTGHPGLILMLAIVLLFIAIKLLTRIIYKVVIGPARTKFQNMVFNDPKKSFGWGVFTTAMLQSSSLTTSLIVPLAATAKVKLRNAYYFLVGANIGTTITALLAATFKTPEAVSVAVAHLLFNIIGGLLFFATPGLNKLPIFTANSTAIYCSKNRIASIVYLVIVFFVLPFTFIYFSK